MKGNSHYKMTKTLKRLLAGACTTKAQRDAYKGIMIDAELFYEEFKKRPMKKEKVDDQYV